MGTCKDPRLTFLNDLGYNVVRFPRKGIVPLGVIGLDQKSKTWLGTLDQIWKTEVAVPAPGVPNEVGDLKGEKTSDLKLSIGLEILANALSGMFGTTAPSLDTAYKNAKSLQFVFKDVQSVGIDAFEIGNFLAQGDLKPNPVVKRFFSGEKNVEALIVTEVLQAKAIGVVGKRDAGTEVKVNVPNIQAAVGAKVSVGVSSASENEVVYEGQEFLVFGFKAFRIGRANGEWTIRGVDPDAEHAFAVGQKLESVVEPDELVDIGFGAPTKKAPKKKAKAKAKTKPKAKVKSKTKAKFKAKVESKGSAAHGRGNNSRNRHKVRATQLRQGRSRASGK
jgi:hypothetical protein